jgi:hypothetical protein
VRARRSNEGASSKGAAEEEGMTTPDQPSGDRRGLEGGRAGRSWPEFGGRQHELLALASDYLSDAP